MRRKALGRGIGALLGEPGDQPEPTSALPPVAAAQSAPEEAPVSVSSAAAELPVSSIDPNPEQPRRRFEPAQLDALADSIQRHGVLQPVVVRRAGERFELLVGERRWRASKAAGLATIPAVISDIAERERLEVAIVENVQRRDLNPIELAHAFRALAEAGDTQEKIGQKVGLDRSTVANGLRLLELPRELQQDVEEERLTGGHARALLQIENPERRRHARDRIVRDGLSVRAAEELARGSRAPAGRRRGGRRNPTDPNLMRVVDALRQRFQTRVRVQGDAARGRIEIEFFGEEDLGRITSLLLGED
ncbi:ParB/RepB/Spo0J family partition protein [Myxococcota bacterium]|nr:ParB/RepB/Spo0J family partition protein [Myxococcota bacterium]